MPPSREPGRSASALPCDDQGRVDLKSLTRGALSRWVVEALGEKPYRGMQVYKWMWQKGARSFDEMTDVSRVSRGRLAGVATIAHLEPAGREESADGTVKYQWRLDDGAAVESVLIPEDNRLTLCISSQVGCAMGCTFCLTGDMGLVRHLRPSEIANQVLQVSQDLPGDRRISNIVFMGMGEPLHNLDNVLVALEILLDDDGLNRSHRRVTVSTAGLVSRMAELAAASPVNLAVSLNATTEEQRLEIMPITRRHSLADLVRACRDFPLPPGKRITFEYVMLRDFNDSLEDAARLYRMLRGIKAKVNLIPYNENPRRDLRRPTDEAVQAFQHYFVSRGLSCSVRTTRGTDISAACGQLGRTSRD